MPFSSGGTPPSSISAYIEDMLNQLSELADEIEQPALSQAIRQAGLQAALINAANWAASQQRAI